MPSVARCDLPRLTSLRFFAAFLVFMSHVGGLMESAQSRQVFGNGRVGVSFFFILSGFVLTWAHRGPIPAGGFYWKRMARIIPLHVATWGVGMLYLHFLDGSLGSRATDLRVLFLVQSWSVEPSVSFAVNGPSWSLSDEAFFYALFPLLLVSFRKLNAGAQWAALIGATLAAGILVPFAVSMMTLRTGTWFQYLFPPVRMLEFAVGCLLALRIMSGWRPRWSMRTSVYLSLASLIVAAFSDQPVAVTLLPFMALICAAALADADGRASWLTSRYWVMLGEWSFALYLIHDFFIRFLARHIELLPVPTAIALGMLLLVVIVPASGLVHVYLERPALSWLMSRQPALLGNGPASRTPEGQKAQG